MLTGTTTSLGGIDAIVPYLTAPEVLWGVLGIVVGIVAVISVILHYHWRHYGVNRVMIATAQLIYFIGLAILVIGAFLSLSAYFLL